MKVLAVIAALAATLAACSDLAGPLGRVRVAVTADRTVVARGDTVRFTASATNPTADRIQIGRECGPALDVQVAGPGGKRRSVLADLLGSKGAFTCELGEYHFADPGETETLHLAWVAPVRPGAYIARAGLRRGGGLRTVSAPIRLTVR
jgi:hypothetical protein